MMPSDFAVLRLVRCSIGKSAGFVPYVQHSAPAQCVAIWRDFVRSSRT